MDLECCKYGCKAVSDKEVLCYCPRGKFLNKTSQTCEDEDECLQTADGGVPVCSQLCANKDNEKDGEYFHCGCVEGYTLLASDNKTCRGMRTHFLLRVIPHEIDKVKTSRVLSHITQK